MRIGIVGAGGMGQAHAGHMARAGHDLLLSNSRGPETLGEVVTVLGPRSQASTREQAAMAPIVLLSVRWDQVRDALAGLPPWEGRILIDATNAVGAGFRPVDLGPRTSSEVVASLAPGARVVKGGNTLPRALLAADASQAGGRRVLFLSGDDAAAKADVSAVFSSMGFAPIDVGDLPAGGRLHQVPGGALTALNLIKLG